MANAKDRQTILYNVIARVGMDGDVLGEFAKAMSSLNGIQTYNELNPPQPPIPQNIPPQTQNGAISDTLGGQAMPSATPQTIVP